MTLEQALLLLQAIIRENRVHQDYKRVCELATLYKQLITGEDCDSLLKQFTLREDDEMFKQRVALTVHIVSSVSDTLINPFSRVGRLDNVKKAITYPNSATGNEIKVKEIEETLNTFVGDQSIEKFLQTDFSSRSFIDPNSFLLVEFDSFDYLREKAKPYPVIVACQNAIHFEYKNEVLKHLVVRDPIKYKNRDNKLVDGFKYSMYLDNDILVYTQVEKADSPLEDDPKGLGFVAEENKREFVLTTFQPKGKRVQAVRVGYKKDQKTEGRTYVNPFHSALPWFRKSLKAVSEMDITMSLHAFAQKLQYVDSCKGAVNDTCNGGVNMNGDECSVCLGSGVKVHKTAQDAVLLPMPKYKDQIPVPLDQMLVYKSPPVDLLKFQDEYVDKLERKAVEAVFNSDILKKTSVVQTATERMENKDEMYNTLQPFAEQYSLVWKKIVQLVAEFTDNGEGLDLMYEFPSDFKLKTVFELMGDLKAAKESNAPSFVIQQISKDIAQKMYKDDPYAYAKFVTKEQFTPFLGKSSDEIKFILSSEYCRKEDQVLWTHSDTIFDELELEVPGFFNFTYEKKSPLVMAKVKTIVDALPKPIEALPFNMAG